MKKIIVLILTVSIISSMAVQVSAEESGGFADVPVGHYAEHDINQLRYLEVTDGIGGNEFGFGDTLTRVQFVVFLGRLMQWELITVEQPHFSDNTDLNTWYFPYVETALDKGIIDIGNGVYRPFELITREEMSLMIVNSLGYGWLAESRNELVSPFDDVENHIGSISMLKDFGIINGKSAAMFDPKGFAKREEAAAILMRMYNRMNAISSETNAFYAVKSYHQKELMEAFDVISYDWADASFNSEGEVYLKKDYPNGYDLAVDQALANGNEIRLSIYGDQSSQNADEESIYTKLLLDKNNQTSFIEEVIAELSADVEFDGVVIDFESMWFSEETSSNMMSAYVDFLEVLSVELEKVDKSLTVMVQPNTYIDGYDYREIVAVVDEMILMAHDYNAKELSVVDIQNGYTITPVAPIESIYEALKEVRDEVKQEDMQKVSLQISFSSAQWKLQQDGSVLNASAYNPLYEDIYKRLIMEETKIEYGVASRNPYAVFVDADGLDNVLWYEDERSIGEKINLAKMFEINNISVWRLGNIANYDDEGEKDVYMNVMSLIK